MDDTVVTLRLPVTPRAPRAARHGVVAGLELHGPLATDTALLVSEAVTNSVLHGGLAGCDVVHVDAWRTEDRVHVEVCDQGGGLSSPSPAGPREGGRGLNLISKIAERWGVESNGVTRIWFELAA